MYIYTFALSALGALWLAGAAAAQTTSSDGSSTSDTTSAPAVPNSDIPKIQDALRRKDLSSVPSVSSEQDPNSRAWAVRAAGRLDPKNGLTTLEAGLQDPAPEVRLAAADELGQKGGSRAVSDLAAALATEKNPGVRQTIAFWLGASKSQSAVSALSQALASDKDANVRAVAAQSLHQIGGSSANRALRSAVNDADPRVRGLANEP